MSERADSEVALKGKRRTQLVYINGRLLPREEAKISVFDHGLLYGDGVFEGIRAYSGRVFKLDEHLDRLYNSAKSIMLEIPLSKEEMRKAVLWTCRENGLDDAYIRLVVTRGVGDLGLDPWKAKEPQVIIIVDEIALYPKEVYENGIRAITVSTRRNLPEAINPAIKSLNYLNNILAKIEVHEAGADEGIMLNAQGFVAEATGENIFIYHSGKLITPPVWAGVLPGITRAVVMDLAREMGIEVAEDLFTCRELYTAEECFLTGTAAEIVPVTQIDGRPVGSGKPGPITKRLMEAFHDLTRREGVPFKEVEGS